MPEYHCFVPANGAPLLGHDLLLGQRRDDALRLGAVVLVRAEVERAGRARRDDLVVEPAELELVPRPEVGGTRADALVAGRRGAALGHQRPPADGVVRAARGVVVVGQAEVVAVLVREHGQAAVLGLDRVVRDPQAGGADLGAAVLVAGRALARVLERLPAVRPDGVLALERVAVGLVAAGVDDLEVVDVAVGLVEVAVGVVVVAVPLVVGREGRLDLRVGLPAAFCCATHVSIASLISAHVLLQTLPAHGKPSLRP